MKPHRTSRPHKLLSIQPIQLTPSPTCPPLDFLSTFARLLINLPINPQKYCWQQPINSVIFVIFATNKRQINFCCKDSDKNEETRETEENFKIVAREGEPKINNWPELSTNRLK